MASKNGVTPMRKLVHPADGDPAAPYPVPGEKKFEEAGGAKFIESPELSAIARALCAAAVDTELERTTRGLNILYLWKAEGGAHHGANTLGKCVKPSGLVRHFSDADFVIWLAADHLRKLNAGGGAGTAAATRFQVEACLYHELKHIGVEEGEESGEEKPVLRPHDLEEFNAVILRYGAWDETVELAAAAFTQMPLWPAGGIPELIGKMQEAVGPGNSMMVTAGGKSVTLPGKEKTRS